MRVVAGAHYGLKDWLLQRVSAAILACYLFVLAAIVFFLPALDYLAWKTLFSLSWFRIFTALALLGLLLHTWVGMRDILMDYIHATALRLFLLLSVLLSLLSYALWALRIFGGIS